MKQNIQNTKGFIQAPKFGAGFTLIEVLVSSAILVILASGFLGLQYIMGQNQVSAWVNYQSIESANRAMTTLTQELRNATQSEVGAYPLNVAGDSEIIFYSDIDFDENVEQVRYFLDGTNLVKATIKPSGDPAVYNLDDEKEKVVSEIVRNGVDPIFYYYNSDWPSDTVNNPLVLEDRISETRYIKIILISNPKFDRDEFDYTLESDIRFRTL